MVGKFLILLFFFDFGGSEGGCLFWQIVISFVLVGVVGCGFCIVEGFGRWVLGLVRLLFVFIRDMGVFLGVQKCFCDFFFRVLRFQKQDWIEFLGQNFYLFQLLGRFLDFFVWRSVVFCGFLRDREIWDLFFVFGYLLCYWGLCQLGGNGLVGLGILGGFWQGRSRMEVE